MVDYLPENLITRLDYPDPDVIRVGDTYYMVSTTMYYFPGAEILRSRDLQHWEHASFVYEELEGSAEERLNGANIYGKGMWAPCFRYNDGTFYISFASNNAHKTYLFTSKNVEGPWKKSYIEGFYYDASLLFDDDGRIFIIHGNRQVFATELNQDLAAPKPGGIHKMIFEDCRETCLGFEGHHVYKINGKYYIFSIHSRTDRWRRTEACHVSDKIDGEYKWKDVYDEDLGFFDQGIAQGGIVDTPEKSYIMILFQDHGAAGRIPVLLKCHFENDFPVIEKYSQTASENVKPEDKPFYVNSPLVGSDNFRQSGDSYGLRSWWQYNHVPKLSLVKNDKNSGTFEITTDRIVTNLTESINTIAMRIPFPGAEAEVTLDISCLSEGDRAGICIMSGCYRELCITGEADGLFAELRTREGTDGNGARSESYEGVPKDRIKLDSGTKSIRLSIDVDFLKLTDGEVAERDTARFYVNNGKKEQLGGPEKLYFTLDHFTGCRFGLFCYSTKKPGGSAKFSDFILKEKTL